MINVVLIEPEIPQNTGNIARTCAAIGATLHIVKPIMFDISDKAVRRAGLDYWQHLSLRVYENSADFFAEHGGGEMYYCSTKAKKLYTEVIYPTEVWLLFGSETRGLPEDLIFNNFDRAVRIPMLENIRSLNLANSVAVVAYEVVRQQELLRWTEAGALCQDQRVRN